MQVNNPPLMTLRELFDLGKHLSSFKPQKNKAAVKTTTLFFDEEK